MERIAVVALLVLAACGAEEWVTYENHHFGYTLEMPEDFEVQERPVWIVSEAGRESDQQTINLVAWDRDPLPIIEVNVNGYDAPLAKMTLYVFYEFMLLEDGSVERTRRWLVVPEDGYHVIRAFGFFTDPDTQNDYSFNMEIWNDQESLFVDIVSSFRLQ